MMSTVHKALSLLDIFNSDVPELTLPEIAGLAEIDRATARRYVLALVDFGFLEVVPGSKKYRLGLAFMVFAGRREIHVPVRKVIEPYVAEIANEINETVHASCLVGNKLATVCVRESTHATRVHLEYGEILPFHCTTSGISFLAHSSDSFVADILSKPLERFFDRTIVDTQKIQAMVRDAARNGFATNPGLYEPDLVGVAAPIVGQSKYAVGSIAVAAPVSRVTDEKLQHWAGLLKDVSGQLESKIGGY